MAKLSDAKRRCCISFLEAVISDANEVAKEIAESLEAQRQKTTLRNKHCIDLFVGEWLLARLPWLRSKGRDLKETEMRTLWEEEVSNLLPKVKSTMSPYHKQMPFGLNDYETDLIGVELNGGTARTLAGLPITPGVGISQSYKIAINAAPKKFGFFGLKKPSETELRMMMSIGDSQCWTLNGDLEGVLNDCVKTQVEISGKVRF